MSIQPEDLHNLHVVGAPAIATDGTVTVSVQRTAGTARYEHRLWRVGNDDQPRAVIEGEPAAVEVGPRLSPDGSVLAFVSDRGGRRQVWLVAGEDHRARPTAELPGSVRILEWLDGERLVAVVDTDPHDYVPGTPAVVEWLRYKRDGRATFFEPTSSVWLLEIASGTATALARPDGRIGVLAVDGARVAYAVEPVRADTIEDSMDVRVTMVDTGEDACWWRSPVPVDALTFAGPGGPLVAVTAGLPGPVPHQRQLWELRRGEDPVLLFPDLDVTFEYGVQGDTHRREPPTRVAWSVATGTLVAAATVLHDVVLLQADIGSGTVRRLTPGGASVTDFAVSADGARLAACLESPTSPSEVFTTRLDEAASGAAALRRRSSFNAEWCNAADLVEPVHVEVDVDEHRLTGLLYRPAGPGPSPLLLRVHGGPHLASGTAFSLETQVEVAAGLAVLLPNGRGSAGRGQVFRSAIVGHWGAEDLDDVMAFVDHVTVRPDIDADRVALAGGSYGGFLTNWALTRTDRFRAAISERSISNFVSKYGTSDNGFLFNRNEQDELDLFDEGVHELVERSPLRHAAAITTPLLLLHGEDDQRCPMEQSEQLFTALRRLGRDVRFVRFAGESHEMATHGRPDHRVFRLKAILSWLREHGVLD